MYIYIARLIANLVLWLFYFYKEIADIGWQVSSDKQNIKCVPYWHAYNLIVAGSFLSDYCFGWGFS